MSGQHPRNIVPIGTAVELLRQTYPDVSHSSLRFLERERLVVPSRTPGGHRLYSPADIQRVRQIKEWQEQRLSLNEIRDRLEMLATVGTPDELAERFLEHALAGDADSARHTILEASNLGMPLSILLTDVIEPALHELGDEWEQGAVSVAQEKEVSGIASELIAELAPRHTDRQQDSLGSVVAACVAGEEHELSLRIITTLLRSRNVDVHFLGTSVDPVFLLDSIRLRQPDLVLLSITLDEHLSSLGSVVDALYEAGESTPLIAGGQAVNRHADEVARWGIETTIKNTDAVISRLQATQGAW